MLGIYRSTRQRLFLGVISGVAERFHLDVKLLRIFYLCSLFFAFPIMFFGYFILAFILPKDYPKTSRYIRRRIPAKKVHKDHEWGRY